MDRVAMDLLWAGLLLLLVGQARGATYFLYQEENETCRMDCKHNGWQIDIDYDHKADCDLRVKMSDEDSNGEISDKSTDNCKNVDRYLNRNRGCTKNNGRMRKASSCLTATNDDGVFSCVDTFQSHGIYPFKSNVENDHYIIAFERPDVLVPLSQTRQKSHINVQEGEPVILTCSFSVSQEFSSFPYLIYWIKIGGNGTTCVYSYEFDYQDGAHYDIQCSLENNLRTRISNTTSEGPLENPHHHNLTIIDGTHSDSGQYLCALNVIKGAKGNWVVIYNVTVTVDKKQNAAQFSVGFALLYVAVALLIIGILAIAVYMKRKSIIATDCQVLIKERHNKGDESIHPDISPYSVAGRVFEPYSVVNLTAKPAANGVEENQATLSTEPYSVVSLPRQCDTLGRPPQEDRKLEHPESPVDAGGHVYETIKDP